MQIHTLTHADTHTHTQIHNPHMKIHTCSHADTHTHTDTHVHTHRYTHSHTDTHALTCRYTRSHTQIHMLSHRQACALLPLTLHYFPVKAPVRVVLPKAVEGSSTETANSTLNWGLKLCSSVSTKVRFQEAGGALCCQSRVRACARTHLLLVLFGVRQHGGHVEHDLVALVESIDRVDPCGVICKTRTRTERAQ